MERLTKRYIDFDGNNCVTSSKGNNSVSCMYKLADLDDLEEQGLLLKLLCRVGDTVYVFLPNDNHFTKAQISKIEIKPTLYGKMCYYIEPVAHRGSLYRYFEDDFGKTVCRWSRRI